jgi:quinoprotein relay system zinc metallohydrolase 2
MRKQDLGYFIKNSLQGYIRNLFSIIYLCLFLSPVFAGEDNSFNLTEIAPGNYVHQGIHAGFGDPGHDDIANTGFIVGEKCVAVIDTGGSVTTGTQLLAALRKLTDKPVCYVINTHIHYDHVLGNLAFAAEKPEFVGHAELADAIAINREFFLEEFSSELGDSPSEDSIIGPGRTVTDTHTIDLGNRKLLLTAWQKSHTHTDLTVYDEQTRTFWAGDLVFRERIPVIDSSLKGWLAVMEKFQGMDVAMIIPGHGPPGSNWEEVMGAQKHYLQTLLTETRQAIADGMFMEEAINTIGAGEKDKWLLFDQQHRTNVSRAFVELEWE